MLNNLLSVNTYDKLSLSRARELGFGLEIEEYLWIYSNEDINERQTYVPELMRGFHRFSFHGTVISRDLAEINNLTNDELLSMYNTSYHYACFHGINRIVFHSNYLTSFETEASWISNQVAFWNQFFKDKPPTINVYFENFIYDTPDLFARLCDEVNDSRFKICLDTGHACCNSKIGLDEWIRQLGKRIKHVHLHNNDGISDKHWPLGTGILNIRDIIFQLIEYTEAEMYVLECNPIESIHWLKQNHFIS